MYFFIVPPHGNTERFYTVKVDTGSNYHQLFYYHKRGYWHIPNKPLEKFTLEEAINIKGLPESLIGDIKRGIARKSL